MLHDLPPLLRPRAHEKQRTQHDAEARKAQRDVPSASDAIHGIRFGAAVADDVRLDGACDSEANGNGVVDHGVDQRSGEALVFFGHGVGQDHGGGGEGHVHAESWEGKLVRGFA